MPRRRSGPLLGPQGLVAALAALLSVKDTGNGYAAISVDGGQGQRVDFHGPLRAGGAVRYVSPRLPYGDHALRIRVTGGHDDRSGASYVSVDRAEVFTD